MSVDEGTWVRRMPAEAEAELIRGLARKRAAQAVGHRPSACGCDACRIAISELQRWMRRGGRAAAVRRAA